MAGKLGRLYMYSFGGVGTRMLYEWLKPKFKVVNNQANVHHGTPPLVIGKNDRVVYLYGDPISAVCSFYSKERNSRNFIKPHCGNLRVPAVKDTIEEYVKNGVDKFRLFNHFKRYTSLSVTGGKTIIVKHGALWSSEFIDAMGLGAHASSFPKKRSRTPKPWLTKNIRDGLRATYREMLTEINNYPGVLIK